MLTKTVKGRSRLEPELMIRALAGPNKEIWTHVPPHLLSFAGSFTQEALGGCGWQCVIVIQVCSSTGTQSVALRHPHFHFSIFFICLFFFLLLCAVDALGFKHGALTEFHVDVLIRVFQPELLILVFVAHERENDFLANDLVEVE